MRHVLFLVLGLVLGALATQAVAARAGDDAAPAAAPAEAPSADAGARLEALFARYERETAVLRTEIDYLKARETSLTRYVLALAGASSNVRSNVAAARAGGFEAAAIPPASRSAVLKALDQLAGDLSGALPVPSANELAMRRKADELRRVAEWK